jgi:lipid-A-disaccharide synthase
VTRLAPVLGETLHQVAKIFPNLRVVLPTVPHVAGLVRDLTRDWPVQPRIVEDATLKRAAFAAADVAIAASGTVSLELAANRVPMVIAYKMNPVTFWLTRRAMLIDTATLVNLVSQTRAVPEFLGQRCTPDLIAPAVISVLQDSHAQDTAMSLTMERLGIGGEPPGLRAARSVLAHLSPQASAT